jgi:hypothetical protein
LGAIEESAAALLNAGMNQFANCLPHLGFKIRFILPISNATF